MTGSIPSLRTVLWRGVRRRCPQCGQGPVFRHWLAMHDHCAVCNLHYLPDQGDLWAYVVAVDRALFILPLIAMIFFRLYNPHSVWFYIFSIVLLLAFVFTMPRRNGMCLGIDYWMRRKWGDLAKDAPPPTPTGPKG